MIHQEHLEYDLNRLYIDGVESDNGFYDVGGEEDGTELCGCREDIKNWWSQKFFYHYKVLPTCCSRCGPCDKNIKECPASA